MLTASAFLLAFVTGCFLAIVRHPIYGLVTYVALIYVHPPSQWWGQLVPSLRWSLLAAAVTLAAVIIHKPVQERPAFYQIGVFKGLCIFLVWITIQYPWALNKSMHMELIVLMSKYALLIAMIYMCIQSEKQLRILLWAHALGCFYLGMIVFQEYTGGRFEGFEAPGISEANAGALLIVSGILTTFVLFLSGRWWEKLGAVLIMPFIVNALVATISRSGFLALGIAGLIFNLFVPKSGAKLVRVFSLAGLLLFISLTNPVYWERIGTILYAGEEVESVDTGAKRLVLMDAQFKMFRRNPLGCGHRCTAVLSPHYLDDQYLTGPDDNRARASHNTFMTLLVEQGVLGAFLYVLLLFWIAKSTLALRKSIREQNGLLPYTYAATIAILAAITVGDMFVDYLKFEPRIWFIAFLMILLRKDALHQGEELGHAPAGQGRARAAVRGSGRRLANDARG